MLTKEEILVVTASERAIRAGRITPYIQWSYSHTKDTIELIGGILPKSIGWPEVDVYT